MTIPQADSPRSSAEGNTLDVLVGKWFHTTTTCDCPAGARIPSWQGRILGAPAESVLLVQLYEWILGEPGGQELITLLDFMAREPMLYDTLDDMKFEAKYGSLSHQDRCKGGRK